MRQARGRIVPVLLSGGTGSRLWPLSRETYPKQLISLLGANTLLQQTALKSGACLGEDDIVRVQGIYHHV